jgi:uncharacterized protein (DUF736 family)
MANIGSFTKSGESYKGEIVTMSVQTKNVRIVPEEASENENAPTHRVFVGRAEIGAAWTKTSKEDRAYLSVKLDDPSWQDLQSDLVTRPQGQRRISQQISTPPDLFGRGFAVFIPGLLDRVSYEAYISLT